jgi:hypothetical protein
MTCERWQKVDKLFEQALEKEPDHRRSFLEAYAGDEELRREVDSLLYHEGQGRQFLEQPALQAMAGRLVGESPSLVGRQFYLERMPPRMTGDSCRPRASNKTLVGKLPPSRLVKRTEAVTEFQERLPAAGI